MGHESTDYGRLRKSCLPHQLNHFINSIYCNISFVKWVEPQYYIIHIMQINLLILVTLKRSKKLIKVCFATIYSTFALVMLFTVNYLTSIFIFCSLLLVTCRHFHSPSSYLTSSVSSLFPSNISYSYIAITFN